MDIIYIYPAIIWIYNDIYMWGYIYTHPYIYI